MSTPPRSRRIAPFRIALLVVVLVLILEIFTLGALADLIGGWWTFLLVMALSALGLWVIVKEGGRARGALMQAVQQGRTPEKEIADGLVVLVGGVLLFVPGVITGIVGLLLVIPGTRRLARSAVLTMISKFSLGRIDVIQGEQVIRVDRIHPDTPGDPRPTPPMIEGTIIDPPTPPRRPDEQDPPA